MQPSLFNRARYRNPNRCPKHRSRVVTHRIVTKTSNPKRPTKEFQVCGDCARPWESVADVRVEKINEARTA